MQVKETIRITIRKSIKKQKREQKKGEFVQNQSPGQKMWEEKKNSRLVKKEVSNKKEGAKKAMFSKTGSQNKKKKTSNCILDKEKKTC